MTKKAMLDYIEYTGMVIDFDRKYLMRRDKWYIEHLYKGAIEYAKRYNLELPR